MTSNKSSVCPPDISDPIPILQPPLRYVEAGHIPDARLELLVGQCAM